MRRNSLRADWFFPIEEAPVFATRTTRESCRALRARKTCKWRNDPQPRARHFPAFLLSSYQPSRFSIPVLLAAAIERLYDLNVGITPLEEGVPHEKPHKPLLLLAVFDLIDEGLATPDHIPWCQEIRDRFTARFLLVKKHNDQNNPDLPFRYLAGDGFWQAFEADGKTTIRREIRVSDIGHVFARFTDGFQYLVAIPANRQLMREALIGRRYSCFFLSSKIQHSKFNIARRRRASRIRPLSRLPPQDPRHLRSPMRRLRPPHQAPRRQ
jgi:hypothetical protein